MTIEDLGRAVHEAKKGSKVVFLTKAPAQWLLGFLEHVAKPDEITTSMRRARYGRGWVIISQFIDEKRMEHSDVIVIRDDDCHMEEYNTYLGEMEES